MLPHWLHLSLLFLYFSKWHMPSFTSSALTLDFLLTYHFFLPTGAFLLATAAAEAVFAQTRGRLFVSATLSAACQPSPLVPTANPWILVKSLEVTVKPWAGWLNGHCFELVFIVFCVFILLFYITTIHAGMNLSSKYHLFKILLM